MKTLTLTRAEKIERDRRVARELMGMMDRLAYDEPTGRLDVCIEIAIASCAAICAVFGHEKAGPILDKIVRVAHESIDLPPADAEVH